MDYTLRDLQLCELEILKRIKKLCEDHGICYYLSSGTLLGAVRHGGFIPWDDDVDIEMPYPDYLHFLSIAQNELGADYFIQNSETDPHVSTAFSKVRKNHTTMIPDYDQGLPGHHGVWIDVFPLVSIKNEADLKVKKQRIRISNFLTMDDMAFSKNEKWLTSQSSALMMRAVKFFRAFPLKLRKWTAKLLLRPVFRYGNDQNLGIVWTNITDCLPVSIYDGPETKLKFEDDEFSVPPKYIEYLERMYGDWKTPPPENQRSGGHGTLFIDLSRAIDE